MHAFLPTKNIQIDCLFVTNGHLIALQQDVVSCFEKSHLGPFQVKIYGTDGIISLRACPRLFVGDGRLGSMETGAAIVRAMLRVMEHYKYKVDVINMSYGEHTHFAHSG